MKIEIIIFDVGNVILKANHEITFKILRDLGVSEKRIKTFFKNKDYQEFSRGNINNKKFYQTLVEKYLQHNLSYDQIVNAHNQHIYEVDEEVIKLFQKLSPSKLVFLTDTNTWQTDREKELINLLSYSDTIFRSHKMHMLKIDKNCFPHIINQLKCNPHQILLIDDSIEKIKAAQKYGLKTIQFKNPKQLVESLN